ncbi:hypothetical protein ACWF94_21005 [Streptomyces sp. NPDC055078]
MTEGRRTPQESRRRHQLADADSGHGWKPQRGDLVHDTGRNRTGVVIALPEDTGTTTYQLSPEGGGNGWTAPASRLMPPAEAAPPPDGTPTPAVEKPTPAALYICAARSPDAPGLAEERAIEEGQAFAERHNLHILAEITDRYGEPDPVKRPGWLRVRALAASSGIRVVIVRWPSTISQAADLRQREIAWHQEQGVRLLFSWAPLSAREAEKP